MDHDDAAITALKESVEPEPGAIPCDPDVAVSAPLETATDQTPTGGAIPDGICEVTLTKADALPNRLAR